MPATATTAPRRGGASHRLASTLTFHRHVFLDDVSQKALTNGVYGAITCPVVRGKGARMVQVASPFDSSGRKNKGAP